MKKQENLADLLPENNLNKSLKSNTLPDGYQKEQKIYLDATVTNPNTDDPGKLGLFELVNKRCHEFKLVLDTLKTDQEDYMQNDIEKWFISQCWNTNINYESLCLNKLTIGISRKNIDAVYLNHLENYTSNSLAQTIIQHIQYKGDFTKDTLDQWEDQIIKSLNLASLTFNPLFPINDWDTIRIETNNGFVTKTKITKDGKINKINTLLYVAPIKVIEFENVDHNEETLFQWTFTNRYGKIIQRPPETLDQTKKWIAGSGNQGETKNIQSTLSACLNALHDYAMAHCSHEYMLKSAELTQGFHYRNGKIIVSDYELHTFEHEDIIEAIEVLEEYVKYFTKQEESYVATTFKWGLFAPFDLCYKQNNRFMEWLYLHGTAGVGKTKGYGGLIHHMWFDDFSTNNFVRSSDTYSTPARLGNTLNKTTFPVCLNETERIFEPEKNTDMRGLYKDAVENILLRETQGSDGKKVYAYSPAICTSNGALSDESGAITRRSIIMYFTSKIQEAKAPNYQEFDDRYNIGKSNSRLNMLRPISHAFSKYMIENPQILCNDWKDIVDEFLTKMYEEVGLCKPEWLNKWVDSYDSISEQAQEAEDNICDCILEILYNEKKPNMTSNDPILYVQEILRENGIAGLFINRKEQVYITQTFLNRLVKKGYLEHNIKVKQFAENYGWHYNQNPTKINKRTVRGCWIDYIEFVEWVYGPRLDSFTNASHTEMYENQIE